MAPSRVDTLRRFRSLGGVCSSPVSAALLLALLSATSVQPAAAADKAFTDVTVETNRRAYLLGDVVEVKVTNKRDVPIFLPGCESFQLERFVEDSYQAMPVEPCVREGTALLLSPGTRTFEYKPGRDQLKQLLRVTLVFGWGCAEGRALSSARCDDFATVRSSSFRLSTRPE